VALLNHVFPVKVLRKVYAKEPPMSADQKTGDVHPLYLYAFNSGDIEATVACYESQGCFVSKSGRIARGTAELREVYRTTFSNTPQMKLESCKVIPAGDDLALVIVGWTSTVSSGEPKVFSGTATDIVRRQADGIWKLVLDNPYGVG
jgi:uncharacterized protein (TIGR02246 family)